MKDVKSINSAPNKGRCQECKKVRKLIGEVGSGYNQICLKCARKINSAPKGCGKCEGYHRLGYYCQCKCHDNKKLNEQGSKK